VPRTAMVRSIHTCLYQRCVIMLCLPSIFPDERIILFEKERLRLRKALQSQAPSNKDGKSVATESRSLSPAGGAASTTSGSRLGSASKLPTSEGTPSVVASAQASVHSIRTMSSQRNPVTPVNRSLSGAQSTSNTQLTGKTPRRFHLLHVPTSFL